MANWWQLDAEAASAELKADLARGPGEPEARARLAQYGPNQLQEQKRRSPLRIFADQFADMIVRVLIGAAARPA
jgi:Ca2+-transporting ATPase